MTASEATAPKRDLTDDDTLPHAKELAYILRHIKLPPELQTPGVKTALNRYGLNDKGLMLLEREEHWSLSSKGQLVVNIPESGPGQYARHKRKWPHKILAALEQDPADIDFTFWLAQGLHYGLKPTHDIDKLKSEFRMRLRPGGEGLLKPQRIKTLKGTLKKKRNDTALDETEASVVVGGQTDKGKGHDSDLSNPDLQLGETDVDDSTEPKNGSSAPKVSDTNTVNVKGDAPSLSGFKSKETRQTAPNNSASLPERPSSMALASPLRHESLSTPESMISSSIDMSSRHWCPLSPCPHRRKAHIVRATEHAQLTKKNTALDTSIPVIQSGKT
jgi:hypothetical protein